MPKGGGNQSRTHPVDRARGQTALVSVTPATPGERCAGPMVVMVETQASGQSPAIPLQETPSDTPGLDATVILGPALTPPTDSTDETWAAITLTPEDAHAILTDLSYLDEHDIDFLHVGMLADKMQAGGWLPLSQITFVISATGEPQLVDGHHRLHAVIVAGFTDKWIVCSFWNQRYSGSDMHKKLNSVREPRGDADIGRVLY